MTTETVSSPTTPKQITITLDDVTGLPHMNYTNVSPVELLGIFDVLTTLVRHEHLTKKFLQSSLIKAFNS